MNTISHSQTDKNNTQNNTKIFNVIIEKKSENKEIDALDWLLTKNGDIDIGTHHYFSQIMLIHKPFLETVIGQHHPHVSNNRIVITKDITSSKTYFISDGYLDKDFINESIFTIQYSNFKNNKILTMNMFDPCTLNDYLTDSVNRYVFIQTTLDSETDCAMHSTLIIFDIILKTVYYLDPNGNKSDYFKIDGFTSHLKHIMEIYLEQYNKLFNDKYIFCGNVSIRYSLNNCNDAKFYDNGNCVMWTLFFEHYIHNNRKHDDLLALSREIESILETKTASIHMIYNYICNLRSFILSNEKRLREFRINKTIIQTILESENYGKLISEEEFINELKFLGYNSDSQGTYIGLFKTDRTIRELEKN